MNYFVCELLNDEKTLKTAGTKARDDVNQILEHAGWKPITVIDQNSKRKNMSKLQKLLYHKTIAKEWEQAFAPLKRGEKLVIQFPVINHSLLLFRVIENLSKRGVCVYLLIHDLEMFRGVKRDQHRFVKNMRTTLEEKKMMQYADRIIAHNEKMKETLTSFDIPSEKIKCLGIFDYLIPHYLDSKEDLEALELRLQRTGPVIIAGNLRPHKAAYAYALPENCAFHLYGVGYEAGEQDHVRYFGAFEPDELPSKMEGSFGLVWDGNSSATCAGTYGEYLKINNPHKTSLYLAAGIPVAIWKEAALAPFILEHHCGIAVDALTELSDQIQALTDEEYKAMKQNALLISQKLRHGAYLLQAIAD